MPPPAFVPDPSLPKPCLPTVPYAYAGIHKRRKAPLLSYTSTPVIPAKAGTYRPFPASLTWQRRR